MIELGEFKKSLYRKIGTAISDYRMIEEGDKILVALSGGKDSFSMLDALSRLREKAPVRFSLLACTVDPGFPGFSTEGLAKWLRMNDIEYHVEKSSIYESVFKDRLSSADGCFYCARLRRSVLYRVADMNGCGKIALGHHRDDFIESVLLSMLYNGRIETMLPVFESRSKKLKVIRPLLYVAEDTTMRYARARSFPVICCYCPLCCGGGYSRRKKVKRMLSEFEKDDPQIKGSLLQSLSNLNVNFMLDMRHNEALKKLAARETGDL